jgi:transcription elongation factor Elf1
MVPNPQNRKDGIVNTLNDYTIDVDETFECPYCGAELSLGDTAYDLHDGNGALVADMFCSPMCADLYEAD